jgi:hypothetical protein
MKLTTIAVLALTCQLGWTQATKESPKMRAAGAFDVKLSPQQLKDTSDPNLARITLDKQYHGDLEAIAHGEMLTAATSIQNSAGYVAIEKVTGKLHGKTGTFVLQHSATMNRGTPEMNIIVVPDSGTGELAGLSGRMKIIINGGKHSYEFDYQLPATR